MPALFMVLLMVSAGLYGALDTKPTELERTYAVALQRGTDSDWVEFCDQALIPQNAKHLTATMKSYVPDCLEEMGGDE